MRSSEEFTPSLPNAFSSSFLHRVAERDEPPTAGEADAAGPWRLLMLPDEGFGDVPGQVALEAGQGLGDSKHGGLRYRMLRV